MPKQLPPLRVNGDRLVKIAVQAGIAPAYSYAPFDVDVDGRAFALPATGGITLNVVVGDSVFGWAGDHIEPGVSLLLNEKERTGKANAGLNFLACYGNVATLVSGEAQGAKGRVLGHHGGVHHVIVDFPIEVMERMTLDDKVLIHAFGQGMTLLDHPEVHAMNMDPELLAAWPIRVAADGALEVPVTTLVPGHAMGSGIGSAAVHYGDYDILTHDPDTVSEYQLNQIRFGDLVAILDHDNRYGRTYRKGAVSVGVVVHSDCKLAGHGPGVATLLTALGGKIRPVLDPGANVGRYLGMGRFREGSSQKKKGKRV